MTDLSQQRGIISRWYMEKEGGKDKVGKLILMGSPWDGAPKAVKILYSGLDTHFRRGFNLFKSPDRTRDFLRTFPSSYQLLPVRNPFLRDLNNEMVDVFEGSGWLTDPLHRQYLEDGRRFNQELGTPVPAVLNIPVLLRTQAAGPDEWGA